MAAEEGYRSTSVHTFDPLHSSPYGAQLLDRLAAMLPHLPQWSGMSHAEVHAHAGGQQRSLPAVTDFRLALVLVFLLPAARRLLDRTLFEEAAHSALRSKKAAVSKFGDARSKLAVVKYKESAWKCVFYGLVWLYGAAVITREDWFGWDTKPLWSEWPHHTVTFPIKVFYMLELAYYLFGILAVGLSLVAPHLAWETRRKDSTVMLVHHVAASVLLGYSYVSGFVRIGTLVLLLHDLSDVLMEGAKLCKYAGREGAASAIFVLFALSWLVLRLIYYPFVIIRSTSFEAAYVLGRLLQERTKLVFYYAFNTSLTLVLVLHIYWFYLILKIIKKQISSGGKVDDVRSDSDDD